MTRPAARLAGKVALVTHAAQGVGAGIARRFAAEGAAVVIHGDDAQGAARLVAEIVWRGGRAIAAQGDVTHWPDVRRLFDEALSTFGGLDILVNGAGLAAARGHEELLQNDDMATPSDELFGAMLLCQEAVRIFGSAGGNIINLTSLEACTMAPAMCPDSAADTAIDMMTRGLARALGPRGIRAHAIALDAAEPRAAVHVLDDSSANAGFITVGTAERGLPNAIGELAVSLTSDAAGRPGRAVMIAGS